MLRWVLGLVVLCLVYCDADLFVKITATGELVGTLCCCCASRILIASLQALSSPPFVGSSFVSDRSEPSSLLHTDRTARSRIDTCFDRAVQKYLWFVSRRVAVPLTACATGLLETVLFANIRFHDTVSRGRLLNRFGKDFEGAAEWSRVSARFAESCVSCFCFFCFFSGRYRQQPVGQLWPQYYVWAVGVHDARDYQHRRRPAVLHLRGAARVAVLQRCVPSVSMPRVFRRPCSSTAWTQLQR